ncbi:MAG TPA: hypothetical protein VH113_12265 [Gemmatimonadales bacterium]|jgi:hypothetical protein|nr:hypothetical protein [Gemmatimonadales bacterium]
MKPILQLAAVGVAGVVLFKLAALLFLPLLAILFKVVLVMVLVLFLMKLLRKSKKDGEAPAT